MQDNVHNLIKDTLSFLKDPLFDEELFLVSESCKEHFAKRPLPQAPAPTTFTSPSYTPPPLPKKEMAPLQKKELVLPPTPPPTANIQAALQKILPSLRLTETIPDDREGKKSANLWKEKLEGVTIVLLALSQEEETLEFLKTLAKAIDSRLVVFPKSPSSSTLSDGVRGFSERPLGHVKIISAERLENHQSWDLFFEANSFRLIIASHGMENYKLLPNFLKNQPFLSLEHPSVYKQIEKKGALWKTLCQMLQ